MGNCSCLAKEGVKVALTSSRGKEGEETVHVVKQASGEGIFVKTDVTNEDDVRSLRDKTVKTYDRLDYAINNAGTAETMTRLKLTCITYRNN